MKLPVVVTTAHHDKSLELDAERETIALLGQTGGRSASPVQLRSNLDPIARLQQ